MITTQLNNPKVEYKTHMGLQGSDVMIPFPFFDNGDVVVAVKNNARDQLLMEGNHYIVDGCLVRLNAPAIDLGSGLDVLVSVTRNRNLGDLGQFVPQHPVKADDLNDNFLKLWYKTQENETLIRNHTTVSEDPPVLPYKGQHWLHLPFYREYIHDGSSWVQPN